MALTNKGVKLPLTEVNAELGLPWGLGKIGGTWQPDDSERSAAWELLVELATRVALTKLRPGEGLLRESLSSLNGLFPITRDILRRYGPGVVKASAEEGFVSLGVLAISVLNGGIRPLLSYWHPTLSDHEQRRPSGTSAIEWERNWSRAGDLRHDLETVQSLLMTFAGLIAEVCNARPLIQPLWLSVPDPPGSA